VSLSNVLPMRDSRGILWQRGKRQRPSEGELADRLAERHSGEVRYATWKRKWIAWNGEEWLADEMGFAQRLAPAICKEAAAEYDRPALDSARTVSGVLSLAKCDRRLVVDRWPCQPELERAVDEWLADHCELDAKAWTPRADLLASFPSRDQFDQDELLIALAERNIVRRRQGNAHGFDGVRIREAGDVAA
jgi:hypothetical protein